MYNFCKKILTSSLSSIQDTHSCALLYISSNYSNVIYVNLTLHHFFNSSYVPYCPLLSRDALITQTSRFDHPIVSNRLCERPLIVFIASRHNAKHKQNTPKTQNDKPTAVELTYVPVYLTPDLSVYFLLTAYLSMWCRNRTHDFTHLN